MWKWIVGGLLVLVVLVAGTCYYGIKKLTSGGDTAVVMIGASPERVFASLADPDSLTTWVDKGSTVTSSRHGLLQVDDTFHVVRPGLKAGRTGETTAWRVMAVDPGHTLTLTLASDSLAGVALITRHDSLAAIGDSTRLSVSYGAQLLDSTRMSVKGAGKNSGAVMGFAQKMIVAAMRLSMEQDLQRLKARIEKH